MSTQREMLCIVLYGDGAARVTSDAQTYEELMSVLGVACQHLLSMVDNEHYDRMVADMHQVIDEARERGLVGRFVVMPALDEEE